MRPKNPTLERLFKRAALIDREAATWAHAAWYYGDASPRAAIKRMRAIIARRAT